MHYKEKSLPTTQGCDVSVLHLVLQTDVADLADAVFAEIPCPVLVTHTILNGNLLLCTHVCQHTSACTGWL